jgi:hypothetical protein
MSMEGFEHQVAWREFREVQSRPARATEDAFVKARKQVDYDFSGSGRNWRVTGVRASIVVNGAESWVVPTAKNNDLLRHEQGHFDITALGMREEAQRTAELTGRNQGDLRGQYEELREEINRKIARANARYDARTEHSGNATAQQRWNQSIRAAKARDDGTIDDLPA